MNCGHSLEEASKLVEASKINWYDIKNIPEEYSEGLIQAMKEVELMRSGKAPKKTWNNFKKKIEKWKGNE